MTFQEAKPKPNSFWLVVVECRYNVIAVCASGKGFYIPGQEPCWGFDHVAEWITEIDPEYEEAKIKMHAKFIEELGAKPHDTFENQS